MLNDLFYAVLGMLPWTCALIAALLVLRHFFERPGKLFFMIMLVCGTIEYLTGWALENSVVTADSMRARGYGTAKRSSFRLTKFEKSDLILTAILVLTAAIAFICAILGAVSASYSPSIQIAPVSGGRNIAGLAAYNAMLWVPVLCDIREEIQWRISISKI